MASPALALGGAFTLANRQKIKAVEHLILLGADCAATGHPDLGVLIEIPPT